MNKINKSYHEYKEAGLQMFIIEAVHPSPHLIDLLKGLQYWTQLKPPLKICSHGNCEISHAFLLVLSLKLIL